MHWSYTVVVMSILLYGYIIHKTLGVNLTAHYSLHNGSVKNHFSGCTRKVTQPTRQRNLQHLHRLIKHGMHAGSYCAELDFR